MKKNKRILENSQLDTSPEIQELRKDILNLTEKYGEKAHGPKVFQPGVTPIPVSGKVFNGEELKALTAASLDFWLTASRFNEAFETSLAQYLELPSVLTTNSGSSANLLALAVLVSPNLGERGLKPGDEVVTVAAGFPTTINPAILYGLVPVFVDVDIPTYNVNVAAIESAITPKTKAIILAHTLGNPFDLEGVLNLAKKHKLYLIEDCCDALGSTYGGQKVGTFGDLATLSFYPAHQITTGEGGAVFTTKEELQRLLESHRDWGRDCYCLPGEENTCGKRFGFKLGELPFGFDHKYIFSNLGYNLKMTEMQAAIGLAQMEKVDLFNKIRKQNFNLLKRGLSDLEEFLIFPEPTQGSDPAWFGFPLSLREESKISRLELLKFLEAQKIGTRLLMAGDLTRQPYMKHQKFRVQGELKNTDSVMRQTFWIGLYPGLTADMIDFVIDCFHRFFSGKK